MLEAFLTSILIYTAFEISYWYFRWWNHLNKEPLPIVKSLLLAVFNMRVIMLFAYVYHLYTGAYVFTNYWWMIAIWVGSASHLIPIWKQNLNRYSSPTCYFIRAILFSLIIIIVGIYV